MPFRWSNKEARGMFQCQHAFLMMLCHFQLHPWPPTKLHWSICLSTNYVAFVNLLLVFLLIIIQKEGEHFAWLVLVGLPNHFTSYEMHSWHHGDVNPFNPTSNTLGMWVLALQYVHNWIFSLAQEYKKCVCI